MDKLRKHRLWLMCGIPGSGKSTWIKTHKHYFSENMAIISRDAIRFALLGEKDAYFSKEKEVWAEYINQSINSLENNTDTILDATHINESSRGKILRALGEHLKDVEINAILINTDVKTAIERNNLREGLALVPETAIKNMYSQLTFPTLEEGFDHIYIYEEENGKVRYNIIEK